MGPVCNSGQTCDPHVGTAIFHTGQAAAFLPVWAFNAMVLEGCHVLIDGLQYCNYSEKIFRQMRDGGVDAVHVTICYHENFRETVANLEQWNRCRSSSTRT